MISKALYGATPPSAQLSAVGSRAFSQSGYYVMRSEGDYMMIRCAPVPFGGVSCHCHNDALGFELQVARRSFFIDPGTYSYAPYTEWRNYFRSSAAHNVLWVRRQEQNAFGRSVFDYVDDHARPRCLQWRTNANADFFAGEHRGYRCGTRPLVCTRSIEYHKARRRWTIKDTLELERETTVLRLRKPAAPDVLPSFEWRFHLHPDVQLLSSLGEPSMVLESQGVRITLEVKVDSFHARREEGWMSDRYACKRPITILCVEPSARQHFGGEFTISFVSEG